MESKEIMNIASELIYQNPDNPRKDLGDLSELAESIKKKGIMQNLAVIPGHWDEKREWHEDGYTLVIGHRRHAAGKLVGLAEFPCRVVTNMDQKDQVGTMLEENMHRNDLTVWEQAYGFQMMLDLGDTENQIAEKTGFSKMTIRHRLNIAKLDQKELKKKEQDDSFQLTMKDLYELEKVADIKTRNKILKEATNSRELTWKAQNAVNEAERNKKTELIVNMLNKLGIDKAPKGADNEQYTGKWETVKEISLENDVPKQIRLPKGEDNVYYIIYYRSVRIIKKVKKKKALTPEEIARKQRDKDKKVIKDKLKEMDKNRKEFIQNIISGKINAVKNENEIREMAWSFLMKAGGFLSPSSMMKMYLDKIDYQCTEEERSEAQKKIKNLSFTHSMLVAMHCSAESIGEIYDWQGYYRPGIGEALKLAYDALRPYGWTFANDDDEKLLDGTHELYVKKEVTEKV